MAYFNVILPTNRIDDNFHRAVESVMKQSFNEFRLIIVLDDPNLYYYNNDQRIIVTYNRNGFQPRIQGWMDGLAYNKNASYYLTIDSDDEFSRGLFKKLRKLEEIHDIVEFSYDEIYDDRSVHKETRKAKNFYYLIETKYTDAFRPNLWCKMLSKSLIERYIANYFNVKDKYQHNEDVMICMRFSLMNPLPSYSQHLEINGYKYYLNNPDSVTYKHVVKEGGSIQNLLSGMGTFKYITDEELKFIAEEQNYFYYYILAMIQEMDDCKAYSYSYGRHLLRGKDINKVSLTPDEFIKLVRDDSGTEWE